MPRTQTGIISKSGSIGKWKQLPVGPAGRRFGRTVGRKNILPGIPRNLGDC